MSCHFSFNVYSTIVSLSIVYAVGNVMMSLSAIRFGGGREVNMLVVVIG